VIRACPFRAQLPRQFNAPSFDLHDQEVFDAFPGAMADQISNLAVDHFLGEDHTVHVFGFKSPEVQSNRGILDRPRSHCSEQRRWSSRDERRLRLGCGDIPVRIFGALPMQQTISQINEIDICATFSLLFGFPIPADDLCATIPNFFPDHSLGEGTKQKVVFPFSKSD
jgi:hypothetical protein